MAFNWDQYQQMPTTGGVTGNGSVDPSQLSMAPPSISFDPSQAASSSPMQGGGGIAPTTGAPNAGNQTLPGDSSLPGYGDWNTSNPWRDSLTYEQIRDFSNGGQTGSVFGSGVNTGANGQVQTSGQPWDQNYFATNFGTPKTPQELVALESKIVAAGGKVLRNASGVAGKIQTPDGRIIDVINSAGAGGNGFQWLEGPGGGPGGNGPLSGSSMGNLGYSYGSSMAPWNEQFSAPTQEQALNTPGVQFGLEEANRMMQNSAAAKGTLLNGRFQQALAASNIGNAMQQYGDVYNRGLNEYLLKRQNFYNNQDRPFDKNLSLAKLGAPS